MSSILTNSSAMVALQTMKSINQNLSKTQSEIATGKSVASARDNAAVWAISKVMESDVTGFKGISDSLALGSSTVAVAQTAAESVESALSKIKDKIISAQDPNVDRTKIQTEIADLRSTIGSIVGAAQFNGLNLVNGSNSSVNVLSSLDRSSSGVTASSITVTAQDLSIGGYTANNVFAVGAGTSVVSTNADTFTMSLNNGGGANSITIKNGTAAWAAGDKVSMQIGAKTASYTVTAADVTSGANTVSDLVAVGLKNSIDTLGVAGLTVNYNSASPGKLSFANAGTTDLAVSGQFSNAGSGGLGALSTLDVSTSSGASAALGAIEGMIQTSINAAASFGSAGTRITAQADFIGKLTDSMKTGIGALVDTNMEEASARLQALQVQQQLSTQALSIANQQPQSLLSLFR